MATLIIAHRGVHAKKSEENTPEAFAAAVAVGADVVELDVRKDLAGSLVVSHDPVAEGNVFLSDVLSSVGHDITWDIEIKEAGIEHEVSTQAYMRLKNTPVYVTSFIDTVLKEVKTLLPHAQLGLIVGLNSWKNLFRTLAFIVSPHKKLQNMNVLVLHKSLYFLGFLGAVWKPGLQVWVWTLNTENTILQALKDSRVTGIITDKPHVALKLRDGHERSNS